MTLTKRIIPCLDVKDGYVVKGINFINLQNVGDPIESSIQYCKEGADELAFLDISASVEARRPLYQMIRRIASKLTIPFTVGGGIRKIEEVREILSNGADKVTINTAAVETPDFIQKLANTFGNQCVVAAIDAKCKKRGFEQRFEVYTYGGRKNTGIDVVEWALEVESLGAGEILLTSMDRDGTRNGYDIVLTRLVAESVNIPVIASGGAGGPESFLDILTEGKADAALAASSFHFKQYPIPVVKEYLSSNNVEVRI